MLSYLVIAITDCSFHEFNLSKRNKFHELSRNLSSARYFYAKRARKMITKNDNEKRLCLFWPNRRLVFITFVNNRNVFIPFAKEKFHCGETFLTVVLLRNNIILQQHCPKNNLDFRIKTKPVPFGADTSVFLCERDVITKARYIPLHLLQLWLCWFVCRDSFYFWHSVVDRRPGEYNLVGVFSKFLYSV